MDGAFTGRIALQFVLEHRDDGRGGEQAAVVGECSKVDDVLFVLEGRDAVADGLDRFFRYDGADGGADVLQRGAGGLGDAGEIGVDGSEGFHACGIVRRRT